MKESDLFNPTRNWLELNGWTVYGEVGGMGGSRADIVGEQDGHYVVCEMKRSLSLKVIEQAEYWKPTANLVFIVVPYHPKGISTFTYRLLKQLKIGLIEIDLERYNFYAMHNDDYAEAEADEMSEYQAHWMRWNMDISGVMIRSKHYLHVRDKNYWQQRLYPELKGQIGGVKGAYLTPYKITRSHLKEALIQAYYDDMSNPYGKYDQLTAGYRSIPELVETVQTHYANPSAGLYKILSDWEADKVEVIKQGRRLYYRIKDKPRDKAIPFFK